MCTGLTVCLRLCYCDAVKLSTVHSYYPVKVVVGTFFEGQAYQGLALDLMTRRSLTRLKLLTQNSNIKPPENMYKIHLWQWKFEITKLCSTHYPFSVMSSVILLPYSVVKITYSLFAHHNFFTFLDIDAQISSLPIFTELHGKKCGLAVSLWAKQKWPRNQPQAKHHMEFSPVPSFAKPFLSVLSSPLKLSPYM